MKNKKCIIITLLLIFSLSACTTEIVPPADNTSELLEQLGVSYVDTDEWPQNEWTEQLPQPTMSGIVQVGTRPEGLSVHFMKTVPADFEQYIEELKVAEYVETYRMEGEIKSLHSMDNPISVSVHLEKDGTRVQVVYTAESGSIGIYSIGKKE